MAHLHRRFDLRLAVVTAIALLFAQIGAMAHAYSHLNGMDRPSVQQSTGGIHEICGDCLNFAPLLAAAGAPAGFELKLPQASLAAADPAPASRLPDRLRLSFRSRAPPATH